MNVRFMVGAFGTACGVALATIIAMHAPADSVTPTPPPVEVYGVASFPEPLDAFVGGTLQVRLMDLSSPDSAGLLIANMTAMAAPKSMSAAWFLKVPAHRVRAAEDGYFVVSVTDRKGLRFIGTAFPREMTRRRLGSTQDSNMLGIRLAAVPAP